MQIHLCATYSLANATSMPASLTLIMCMSLCTIFVTAYEHYVAVTNTAPYIMFMYSGADYPTIFIMNDGPVLLVTVTQG